jgi:ferric-dicitrate binding protein FerR (iron transport regulator)
MKRKRFGSTLLITVFMGLTLTIAMAGVMPVGALMGSKNATVDGQVPLPHTTLLSGDSLQVKDGLAMVTLDQGNRMILGRQTEASFLRDANSVTVSLKQGNLALYHPQASRAFRVKAGLVTVTPKTGYKTLGEIAVADGDMMVMAKDGVLEVENGGTTQEVAKGKTITIKAPVNSAPAPVPPSKRHLKHLLHFSPALLLYLGLAAEAGGVAWAIVAVSSGPPPPVSPVVPGP